MDERREMESGRVTAHGIFLMRMGGPSSTLEQVLPVKPTGTVSLYYN
jgi:hypothetical protein